MKRWVYKEYGSASQLAPESSDDPKPGPGEVLVKVSAFSINPIDWKLMSGKFRFLMPAKFPAVPCFDLAGVVEDANGSPRFKNGDKIFVRLSAKRGGAAQERVAVDASVAAKIPDGMSSSDAAAIPLAALTALQGLRDHGGMRTSGETKRVLIVGASGGVGHFAVQIAAAAGAYVVGVCGTHNVELVKSLGANEVIDYRKQDDFRSKSGLPYDLVLDCVGQTPLSFEKKFASVMKSDALYVTPAPNGEHFARMACFWKKPRIKIYFMIPSGPDLEFLAGLFKSGKLKVVTDQTYPFERLREAFERSISGRSVGKLVVTMS